MQLRNNSGHYIQDFCISCIGIIAVVVNQYRVQKCRNNVGIDHLQVVGFLDVDVDEFKNLLLNRS